VTTKLDTALGLAARGFKVFPIAPGKKTPPLVKDWPKKATNVTQHLAPWWHDKWPNANIGIHCEGLLVIDIDTKKGGDDAFEFLRMSMDLPATFVTETPTGGRHVFYRLPDNHPGVPNGVESLGKGLDVRSTNGYVVAPGSDIDGTVYSVRRDNPIALAPTALVQKLGEFTKRERPVDVNVPDAPPSVTERAREWLAKQEGAVEGQGGDARTFTVACGLRDLGVSKEQALELLTEWNDRCSPPWTPNELGVKVDNAYNYGQNEPGVAAALPDDFPVVPESSTIAPKSSTIAPKPSTKAQRLSDFANTERKGPGYLVKGLLQKASYAVGYGAPSEGKTFVFLDIGYHVAAGLPWMGAKTHAGLVLHLAYEGAGGLVKRAKALRQKYGNKDVPLYVVNAAFNLREKPGRQELGQLIAELPEKPVLIVIDTLARALMGGDENSAQDVGAFNSAIAALIESTGACVLVIHHSGKNKGAGARGSSALLGAIDTELEVDQGRVTASKQRDVEMGAPVGFKLRPVVVGLDEDGDEQTSCVVEPDTVVEGPKGRLSGNAKRAFEVLCDVRPNNTPISVAEWKEACSEFLSNRKQAIYDVKNQLRKKGFIEIDEEGLITRRCE